MEKSLTLNVNSKALELSLREAQTLKSVLSSVLGTGPGQEPFLIDEQLYDQQEKFDSWKVSFKNDGVVITRL
jgi:hypothetical protein